MKLCIVSTVRSPPGDLLKFLNYHHNLGIAAIYLYFDDPGDRLINSPLLPPSVVATVCSDAYWVRLGTADRRSIETRQIANANHALQAARQAGMDWIAHIDADELIYPDSDINRIMEKVTANISVLRMALREAVCANIDSEGIFDDVSVFKSDVTAFQDTGKALSPEVAEALFNGEYFRGHMKSKCFARIDPDLQALQIHDVVRSTAYDGMTVECLKLLHFDCTTFAAWKDKWGARMDGSGTALDMRPNRKAQMQYFAASSNNVVQAIAAFQRLHCLSDQTVEYLLRNNFAERIVIPPEAFLLP